MQADTYLVFKENHLIQQSNTSANCGEFAVRFLIDRFRGKHFKECTDYDEHIKGEKDIEAWKLKHNIKPFRYVASGLNGEGFFSGAFDTVKV